MSPRSAFQALVALLCAGAVALATAGCGSGGSPLGSATPVAQAATATFRSGGSQIAMSMSLQMPGLASPLSVTGGGSFNMAQREGQLDFRLSGLPAGLPAQLSNATFTELFKDDVLYMSSSLLDGKLPNGARWMKLDLARFAASEGLDLQSLTSGQSNPTDFLQYLRGAGSVRAVGRDLVRGTPTTRYDGTIDLATAAEHAPPADRAALKKALEELGRKTGTRSIPFSVWIDGGHLVRRMKFAFQVASSGQSAAVEVELELYGFGPTPAVNPPAAAETYDATSLSLQGLSASG